LANSHPDAQRIDVIVPAFREAASLPLLVARMAALRERLGSPLRLTIVDDNSRDGTAEYIRSLAADWITLITRSVDRGLCGAVLEGVNRTDGDIIVVMDADLSHPPEKIPEMLSELRQGHDFVIGSRYVEGGATADDWGVLRWLNSRLATLLARPFTDVRDPMSGFFALRRETYRRADSLNPVGYKIALELIVKCRCRRVTEVPIFFSSRLHGQSKLGFGEQLRYIQHLRRLYLHRFSASGEIVQFLLVGLSGVAVNLLALTALLHAGMDAQASIAAAIVVSMFSNFLLNRRFTFPHGRTGNLLAQGAGYALANGIGALVNYGVACAALHFFPRLMAQLASLAGIACATVFNFAALKFIIFKKKHYRAARRDGGGA
jgi:dolichol-phosphate mannosyltransferase